MRALGLASLVLVGFVGSASAAEVSSVSPKPGDGAIGVVLQKESAAAKKKGLRPFVELTASWCKPCRAITQYLADPLMVDAFTGVHLIRLDIDAWDMGKLDTMGLHADGVPYFFELRSDGKATGRKISSSVWGEDIPKNMAPPLKAFFLKR